MAPMNEKPKPIEYYYEWLERAKKNLTKKVQNPPHLPLTDPAWQPWISDVKKLANKYADALIAVQRQAVRIELEGD